MTTPMMILCLRSQPRAQPRSLWLRPPRHSTSIMRVTSTGACLGFQAEATGAPPLGTTCGTGTRFRDSVVSRGSGSFLQASLGDAREDYLRNRASCASAPAGLKRLTRLRASFIRRQVSCVARLGSSGAAGPGSPIPTAATARHTDRDCGMPLLALEGSRPDGLMEDSFELQSSAIIAGVFRCGLIRGECMREFHPALSATTKDGPVSLGRG